MSGNKITTVYENPCLTKFINEECFPYRIDPADTNNEAGVSASSQQIDAVNYVVIKKEDENEPTFVLEVKNEGEDYEVKQFESLVFSQDEINFSDTNAVDLLAIGYEGGSGLEDGLDMKNKEEDVLQSFEAVFVSQEEDFDVCDARESLLNFASEYNFNCDCLFNLLSNYLLFQMSAADPLNMEDKSKKVFPRQSTQSSEEHMKIGGDGQQYNMDVESHKCKICNKAFSQLSLLTTHMWMHNSEKYSCKVCNKVFSNSFSLRRHMRVHSCEKPYKCEVCNKAFSLNFNLITHMRVHSGEKPYKCEVCNKAFSQDCHLNTHMRVHSGEKPYKCEVCMKAFSQNCILSDHMRVHSGEKPYKCEVCLKDFSYNSSLIKHKRVHTGEKPYKCEVCDKAFSTSTSVTRHRRVHSCHKL